MCTVQVALIADVLRLSNGERRFRTPGVPPRSICRRLFRDDSGESSTAFANRLKSEMEREARERWNFDFRTGTPLPGRYQWVRVHPEVRRVQTKVSTELPQTTASTKVEVDDMPPTTLPQRTKARSPTTSSQSKITDFLSQRKRQIRTTESDFPKPLKARRTTDQQQPQVV